MKMTEKPMSGDGWLGWECPKCGGNLEFEDWDYERGTYWDFWRCSSCGARFICTYPAKGWEEIGDES